MLARNDRNGGSVGAGAVRRRLESLSRGAAGTRLADFFAAARARLAFPSKRVRRVRAEPDAPPQERPVLAGPAGGRNAGHGPPLRHRGWCSLAAPESSSPAVFWDWQALAAGLCLAPAWLGG